MTDPQAFWWGVIIGSFVMCSLWFLGVLAFAMAERRRIDRDRQSRRMPPPPWSGVSGIDSRR